MSQTITYKTDHKSIGLGNKVQFSGEVIQIAVDPKKDYITLTIEINEFEKLYTKGF